MGISRDTIHRWIRDGDLDRDLEAAPTRYGPQPAVPTKLDAYRGIIEARLAAYPQLSAVRLLDEIRAAGYAGGYTQLKDFVRQVRPAPPPTPVIRFETSAGRHYGETRVMVSNAAEAVGHSIPRPIWQGRSLHNSYRVSSHASRFLGKRERLGATAVGVPACIKASRFISRSIWT